MKKWWIRIGWVLLASLVSFVIAGVGFEQWSRSAAKRRFLPPGKLVNIDGVESHLDCTGQGTPTVVFESGLDTDGSPGWSRVQPKVAEFTRVCSYDRAGIMWSGARGGARDGKTLASELHALLAAGAEPPPYVMVGHSLGGALVRVFAATSQPGMVVGFVFVDASHPDLLKRDTTALSGGPPVLLFRALAALGLLRLMDAGGAPPALPEDARQRIEAFAPPSIAAVVGEMQALSATFEQAGSTGSLGDRPLVVLTAENKPPERRQLWSELQADLASLSTNCDQRIFPDYDHYIQHEHPEAVVEAVRDVVNAVRGRGPVRRAQR